jgi:DNA polymerase-1
MSARVETWAERVYRTDKRAAELCRDMSVTGFCFDQERAKRLSAYLLDLELDARDRADQAAGAPIRRTKSGGFGDTGPDGLKAAFFQRLGAPALFFSKLTGRPSLGIDAMRHYAASAIPELSALALAVLDWRRYRKIRRTYVEGAPVGSDGRVHSTWQNYGAVSGRFSGQKPNLMNLPTIRTDPTVKMGPDGGVRALYCAPKGHRLVTFDRRQLEMRMAAYASGDPVMIAACESSDLHAANAEIIFGDQFRLEPNPKVRKVLRNLAKTAGFAVCYGAEAETVFARLKAAGENVTLRRVETMLKRMKRQFARYYEWQEQRYLDCVRLGYVETPLLGRRRWLGHDPERNKVSNFPIQGGAADLMNESLPNLVDALKVIAPGARLVAQVHDSAVFEVPISQVEEVWFFSKEISERPVTISSSGEVLTAVFPIDIEISERWS